MIAHFIPADEENVNTAQMVENVLEIQHDNSSFIHCSEVICENCTLHCPCTIGIQQCLWACWVPRCM